MSWNNLCRLEWLPSQRATCFCFTGMHHDARLATLFLQMTYFLFSVTFIHLHVCMQKSEDNLELALSFCHVVPEDRPQTPCRTSQESSDAVYFLAWRWASAASSAPVHQTHGEWCGSRSQLVALLSLQTRYSLEQHWKALIHAGDRIASLLSLQHLWGWEDTVCLSGCPQLLLANM